jgi:hypothetical protein
MPRFLVCGTQKGGTSTLHYVLKSGWHPRLAINRGDKEIHYFAFDDAHAQGPARYQARWDGEGAMLGECFGRETELRGEVSASYLDYPRAAERAFALLPFARLVFMLREPAARMASSFNMRWQVKGRGLGGAVACRAHGRTAAFLSLCECYSSVAGRWWVRAGLREGCCKLAPRGVGPSIAECKPRSPSTPAVLPSTCATGAMSPLARL